MKKIFDFVEDEYVVILYNNEQICSLCKLLDYNNIIYYENEFKGYSWVKINKECCYEFANFGPYNQRCRVISCQELYNNLN